MNKKVIIFVLVGVLVGGGGAAAYFMFLAPKPDPAAANAAPVWDGPPGLVTMESFLVNIASGGGDKFAKLDLRVTIQPFARAEAINADPLLQAKMRDRVLTLLTAKDYEEISTPIGKEGFRRELKTVLQPLMEEGEEEGEIQEVLFQNFVVQ